MHAPLIDEEKSFITSAPYIHSSKNETIKKVNKMKKKMMLEEIIIQTEPVQDKV
jgi:hypothetical protein